MMLNIKLHRLDAKYFAKSLEAWKLSFLLSFMTNTRKYVSKTGSQ